MSQSNEPVITHSGTKYRVTWRNPEGRINNSAWVGQKDAEMMANSCIKYAGWELLDFEQRETYTIQVERTDDNVDYIVKVGNTTVWRGDDEQLYLKQLEHWSSAYPDKEVTGKHLG